MYSLIMNAQYILLGILHNAPSYGYELKKGYDKLFSNNKAILPGQIYSTLSRLKRDQKIKEVPSTEESGGPERVRYAITFSGEEALRTWLDTPELPSPRLQAALYVKTVLAIMQNGDAASYLDSQRRAHIQRMRELTTKRRGATLSETLLIDHALFHIEADLRWIDLTSSRLMKLKEELCL
jgi:DNA-binding PadR family transcriptional regulator